VIAGDRKLGGRFNLKTLGELEAAIVAAQARSAARFRPPLVSEAKSDSRLMKLPWWPLLERSAIVCSLIAAILAWQANELAVRSLDATNQSNLLARQALEDQQISTAWQIMGNRSVGATGKQYALAVLLPAGGELHSLDLGCTVRDATPMDKNPGHYAPPGNCVDRAELSDVRIERKQMATIGESNFFGANFYNAKFSGITFQSVDFDEADFRGATINSSYFNDTTFRSVDFYYAIFEDVMLISVDFTGAKLSSATITASYVDGVNISGATLCDPGSCFEANGIFWAAAWYWEDDPPSMFPPAAKLGVQPAACVWEATMFRGTRPVNC
jgi:hypothetical protein